VNDNNPTSLRDVRYLGLNNYRLLPDSKSIQRGKVLIVDDEIDLVSSLQTYLSEKGYRTMACTSAKGAIEALKKYAFDLLLIDLQLPDIKGIDVLKSALQTDPHLIGIMITGWGTIESAVDAMKTGAFDYLLKPLKFEMLPPILDRAMKVRELSKSEDKCRTLVEELSYRVRELQNTHDRDLDREVERFELKEELESLRESLSKYKDSEKTMFFDGSAIGEY